MKGFKKLTAIILCAIMAFSVIPLSAFATEVTEPKPPYCEIKLKDGFKDEILPGEYVEVYLQYDTGKYRGCSFSWSVSGAGAYGYESLGSFSKEIRVKANTHGTLKVKMRIVSKEHDTYDQVIATDELHITVLDTRTDWEKFRDDIKELLQEIYLMLGFTLGPVWALIVGWPLMIYKILFPH